ncbi:MAG: hypothetical protein J6I64_04215, partial [Lachnospiraceae bacterium]|nr:hypothetical protein [Lachnospiraceae bacterium]
YIYNNVFVYTADTKFSIYFVLKSVLRNTLITFCENLQYSPFIVVGTLSFLLRGKRPLLQRVSLCFLCGFTALGIYAGAQAYYLYYGFIFTVFVVLGFVPILQWLEKRMAANCEEKRWHRAVYGICLALAMGFCYMRSPNVYLLGYPQEEMVQFKFKEIIEETEDPTLLNYGFLDGGFYTVCDIVPTCKYFAKFNIPLRSIPLSQENLIQLGMIDYVITRNFELDAKYDKYRLVAEDTFWFDGRDHEYYLYQLKVTE